MDKSYYIKYWNKKFPDIKHVSFNQNKEEVSRIINFHGDKWKYEVWEMIPLSDFEIRELLYN